MDKSFKLHEALLDFKQVKGRHTGDALGVVLHNILTEFGLCEKLLCITSDNASNNHRLCRMFQRLLWQENRVVWNWDEHHIACLNHVINLCVQDFIKGLKGTKKRGKGMYESEDESEESGDDSFDEEEQEQDEDHEKDDVMVVEEGMEPRVKKKSLAELLKNDLKNPKLQITLVKLHELSKVVLSCLYNV